MGKNNLWTMLAEQHKTKDTRRASVSTNSDLDWSSLEGLFCQAAPVVSGLPPSAPSGGQGGQGSSSSLVHSGSFNAGDAGSGTDTLERKKFRESNEVRHLYMCKM